MGDLLAWGAKKLIFGTLSVIAALVWWTISPGGGDSYEELDRMPTVVFDGGAGTLSIEVETSQPAELHASFSQWDEADEEESGVWVNESLDSGLHTRTVKVAPDTYVYVEIGVPEAAVGAELKWTVFVDGQEIFTEKDVLQRPLQDGYAFFVQLEAENLDEIRSWTE